MKKNKKIILISVLVVTMSFLVLVKLLDDKLVKREDSFIEPFSKQNQALAVYIEDENSDIGYIKNESTIFPTEGYILNMEKSTCTNGGSLSQDLSTKKISLRIEHKSSCSLYFDKEMLSASEVLEAKIANAKSSDNLNFAEPATTDETSDGFYVMEDDYGTSYYYRGATTDNYVKFAGFYWRIIRINGDGSLRILYDGTEAHANGVSSANRLALQRMAWNTPNYNDAKYVGYMYGGANGVASTNKSEAQANETNTNIKTELENWYKMNIADKGYGEFVSDVIYCNDRTTPGSSVTLWTSDTGLGYGWQTTGYGALSRIMTGNNSTSLSGKDNPKPKFKCENKNDAFTKEDTEKGNGKLEQKVGMITADEILAAGSGKYNTNNSSYYLYKGNWYWSLSPCDVYGWYARAFIVDNSGYIYDTNVNSLGGVAPVISLSAEYVSTMKGNGTMKKPFEVK